MPSFSQILAQSVTDAGVQATVVYATAADLPLVGNTAGDIALVSETHRLYIFTGAGWYNVALINTNPTIITAPDGSYIFATDGTPIVLTLEAQDPEEVPITWSYAVTSGALGSTATVSQADNVFTITPSTDENDAGEFSITFTASDGVNLATAVSSFTLVFAVSQWDYAKLSIGTSNSTIYDKTGISTLNLVGQVNASNALTKYDDQSIYFDGDGDVISTNIGQIAIDEDFTVEGWMYSIPTAAPNHQGIFTFTTVSTPGSTTGFCLYILSGTGLDLYNGGYILRVSNAITQNTWFHIAMTRTSNTIRVFINGTQIGSAVSGIALGPQLDIGVQTGLWFKGYMENVQYFKGLSKYTTNFTVPNAEQGPVYQQTS